MRRNGCGVHVGIYRSGTGKSVLSPFKNVPLLDTPWQKPED